MNRENGKNNNQELSIVNFKLIVKDYIRTIKLPKIKSKTPQVVLLIGFPASGKSYLAKNLVTTLPLTLISENDIQSFLVPKISFFERGQKIIIDFAKEVVKELIEANYSCIVDTNLKTQQDRAGFQNLVERVGGETVLIHLNCPEKAAYERIRKRNQQIIGGESEGFIMDWDYFHYEINSTEPPTASEDALTYDSSKPNHQFEKIVVFLKTKMFK